MKSNFWHDLATGMEMLAALLTAVVLAFCGGKYLATHYPIAKEILGGVGIIVVVLIVAWIIGAFVNLEEDEPKRSSEGSEATAWWGE